VGLHTARFYRTQVVILALRKHSPCQGPALDFSGFRRAVGSTVVRVFPQFDGVARFGGVASPEQTSGLFLGRFLPRNRSKTGGKPDTDTPHGRWLSAPPHRPWRRSALLPAARAPGLVSLGAPMRLPHRASTAAVSYWAPYDGGGPRPVLFDVPGFPVLAKWISCSFSSSGEVLFSFPLRYLFAIGHSLSYLALDGQHHPSSASTFKLAYSRLGPSLAPPTRSRSTPPAPRTQLMFSKHCHLRTTP